MHSKRSNHMLFFLLINYNYIVRSTYFLTFFYVIFVFVGTAVVFVGQKRFYLVHEAARSLFGDGRRGRSHRLGFGRMLFRGAVHVGNHFSDTVRRFSREHLGHGHDRMDHVVLDDVRGHVVIACLAWNINKKPIDVVLSRYYNAIIERVLRDWKKRVFSFFFSFVRLDR